MIVLGLTMVTRLVRPNVGGLHDAAIVAIDADRLGLLAGVFDDQALDVSG